jgi:hypothetical protein
MFRSSDGSVEDDVEQFRELLREVKRSRLAVDPPRHGPELAPSEIAGLPLTA